MTITSLDLRPIVNENFIRVFSRIAPLTDADRECLHTSNTKILLRWATVSSKEYTLMEPPWH
ncbi:MAG: hypothetical protein ACI9S8_001647 [Chlamydiales bacterium]|jgi:hypothetical protein